MNALAKLRKRASTAAIPAIPAIRAGQRIAESRESQESQGVKAETRFSDLPPAAPTDTLRAHLLVLAAAAQVDPHHVHRMLDPEVADYAGLSDAQLTVCLHMMADTADRNAGLVPAGDTAAMQCIHCGPVYIHPDIAAVLPVVDGLPRGLGCPWCFVRKAGGTVPSPLVSRASAQPDPTMS